MASPHVSDDESSPPSSTRDPTQSRVAFQSFLSSFNTSDTHVATLRDIVLTQQQVDVLITNVAASEGHVTEFGISGCGIPISSLSALGTALTTLPSLTHVAIEDNAMGNAGVKALCDTMVECKSLQSWGLWKNGITSVGMASIATFLSHHPLLTLDLSVNSLGPAGAELIARILSDDPPLQHLFLANNEIGSAGTIALAQSLTLNKHLLTLGLQWNRIDENGGEALGKALMTNNTLEKLDLRWNSLGRVGNDAILAAATHNTTLTSISLCGHATSESSNLQSALNLLCQRNITRKQPAHDSADGSNGNVSISPSMPSTSPRNIPRAISPSLSSTRYRDSLSHVILQQEREIARQAHHIARLEKRHTLNPVKKRMIRTTTMVSPHTHTHTHTHTTQHHRTLSPAGMTLPPPATSSTIASAIAASTTTTSAATSTSTSTATPTSTSTSTSPSTSTIPASPKQIPASPKQAPMVPPKKKQSLPAASLGLPPAPPSTSASAPSSTHVTPRPSSSSPSPSASTPQRTLQLQTHHEDTSGDVIGLSLSSIPLTARAAINILSMPHVFTCHISNNKRVDRIIFYRSSGELGALVWTDTTTTTLPLSSITSLHHGQSHPHLFTPHTDERCCITILSSATPLCLSAETSDDALSWLHALLYIIIASGRTVSLSTFKHPGSSFTSQQYTVHPLSKAHIPSSPSTHPHSPSPRPSSPFESDDEHESSLASHVNLELAQSIIVLETEVARLTTALQQSQKEENIYDSRARQLTMERDIAMIRTLSLDEVRTLCAGQKACIERMEEEMRTLKAQVAQLQSELTSTRSTAATTQATLESRLANAEQQLQIARTKLSILKTSTNIDDLNDKDVAALDAQVHRISLPRSRTGSSDLAARRAMFEASASSAVATSAAPLPASPMKNRGSV